MERRALTGGARDMPSAALLTAAVEKDRAMRMAVYGKAVRVQQEEGTGIYGPWTDGRRWIEDGGGWEPVRTATVRLLMSAWPQYPKAEDFQGKTFALPDGEGRWVVFQVVQVRRMEVSGEWEVQGEGKV